MIKSRAIEIASIAVLTVALAGCAPAIPPSAPAPAADGSTYGTVADLRDAFTSAGGVCKKWEDLASPSFSAAQQGTCDYLSFSTYASEADKQEYVTYFKDFSGGGHNAILVGQNWIIFGADDDVAEAESLLGGVIVNATS